MSAPFERLAVLGLGLLGGSLALAARRRGLARAVVGGARRADTRAAALAAGAVDEAADLDAAARGADLVVLATPVFAMPEVLRRAAPGLAPGAIATDVGSVKGTLAEVLPGLLPTGARYVGSHPMAGSHHSGFEHAREDLFENAVCIVDASADPDARERVCALWRALGARVVLRDPARHDAEVAWMSHLPHLLAFAFAGALRAAPAQAAEVAGPGFRDFTRIAHGEPELWADILTANRKALAAPLEAVGAAFREMTRAVEANDAEALERWIGAARSALAPGGARGPGPAHDTRRTPDGACGRAGRGETSRT
ncbi:MAG TPA: prephenate dehydrogenase [Myxococcota bacterium]|nr:prephenate dehydrogenase [Myxococcota bacterium]